MESPFWTWIKGIPNSIKWLAGTLTAAISFVLLIRTDYQLALICALSIVVAVILFSLLRIVVAKEPSRLEGGRGVYQFPRYRRWAVLGIIVILTGMAFVLAWPPSRQFLATSLRTAPLTPPPETIHADVIIAEFDGRNANQKIEIARRLERDLRSKLQTHGLPEVTVAVLSPPITSVEQALLEAKGSKALIWGWYDDYGINVHVLITERGRFNDFDEVPWELGSDPNQVSLTIRDVLPENVSFMSLFVIGELYYSANRFAKGRAAFDAAMASMPAAISRENAAALHFFRARQAQGAANPDVDTIVCEYTQSLAFDPHMAQAYNNLGVLAYHQSEPFSPRAQRCLGDRADYSPAGFFDEALELKPESAQFQFNRLSTDWVSRDPEDPTALDKFQKRLVDIVRKDSTIPGGHALLGVIALDRGDFRSAAAHLGRAVTLAPQSARLRFNLAQVLVLNQNYEQAKQELRQLASEHRQDAETHLALANISLLEHRTEEASAYLKLSRQGNSEWPSLKETVASLEAQIEFERGHYDQAIDLLKEVSRASEDYQPSSLWHYLLSLLYERQGDNAAAASENKAVYVVDPMDIYSAFDRVNNDSPNLAWLDIIRRCARSNPDPVAWGSRTRCLPRELDGRIRAVFAAVQAQIPRRLYHRGYLEEPEGGACPYVFTFDSGSGTWRFDTTILYRLAGPQRESLQARALTRFDGRLLIREVEAETSYLDRIHVLVTDGSGRSFELQPQLPVLQRSDGQYLVIKEGNEVLLSFAGLPQGIEATKLQVVARGYYVATKREIPAILLEAR